MPAELLACPHCSRSFAIAEGLFCHVVAKHGRKKARAAVPDHPSVVKENARIANDQARQAAKRDREPSMADLHIDALQARACGEPVDPWVAEMFDV